MPTAWIASDTTPVPAGTGTALSNLTVVALFVESGGSHVRQPYGYIRDSQDDSLEVVLDSGGDIRYANGRAEPGHFAPCA